MALSNQIIMKEVIITLFFLYLRNFGFTFPECMEYSPHSAYRNNITFSLLMMDYYGEEATANLLKEEKQIAIAGHLDSLGYFRKCEFMRNSVLSDTEKENVKNYLEGLDIRYKHWYWDSELLPTDDIKQSGIIYHRKQFKEKGTVRTLLLYPGGSMFRFYMEKGYFSKKDYLEFLFDKTFVERDPLYCK